MPKNYIKQVATAAINAIDSVLNNFCAGGKREGHEYVALNPNRSDSTSGSFKINLNTGAWADFAIDVKGGDLVALVAYTRNERLPAEGKQDVYRINSKVFGLMAENAANE